MGRCPSFFVARVPALPADLGAARDELVCTVREVAGTRCELRSALVEGAYALVEGVDAGCERGCTSCSVTVPSERVCAPVLRLPRCR